MLSDGKHLIGVAMPDAESPAGAQIQIVLNWFEELRQRVPR
jgi:hypothetical protein